MRLLVCVLLLLATQPIVQHSSAETPAVAPDWCRDQLRSGYRGLERVLIDEPWFAVYRIRPGTYALYEPHQFEEVISYLILGKERALLLDTGMGIASIRQTVRRLTDLPVVVLNTHTHPDHIGGNHEFDTVVALDTPFTRANAQGYADAEMKEWVSPSSICGALPQQFLKEDYRIHPFQITRFLRDGEILDLGERQLQVISTPGHTPDSLCLLDREKRLLFTGDTFYPGPIYLFSPETDLAAYRKSIDILSGLVGKLDILLTAHNEPVAPPSRLRELARALREVEEGTAQGVKKDGQIEYSFDGFSLLLATTPG